MSWHYYLWFSKGSAPFILTGAMLFFSSSLRPSYFVSTSQETNKELFCFKILSNVGCIFPSSIDTFWRTKLNTNMTRQLSLSNSEQDRFVLLQAFWNWAAYHYHHLLPSYFYMSWEITPFISLTQLHSLVVRCIGEVIMSFSLSTTLLPSHQRMTGS